MIHHTVGVYLDGSMKHNGVSPEFLQQHVDYNKTFRPGRALFVDGVCVHPGYLYKEDLEVASERIGAMSTPSHDTQPYH